MHVKTFILMRGTNINDCSATGRDRHGRDLSDAQIKTQEYFTAQLRHPLPIAVLYDQVGLVLLFLLFVLALGL